MSGEGPRSLGLRVHGVDLEVRVPDDGTERAVRRFFGPFLHPSAGPFAGRLEVEVPDVEPAPPDVQACFHRGAGPTGPYALYRRGRQRWARFEGAGGVQIAAGGRRAALWLSRTRSIADDALLSFSVAELLKSFGTYTLHGAALAKDGLGVVLCGASGSGKSTSSVALVAGGYDYLSDDYPLWRMTEGGPRLLSFALPFKLLPSTLGFFPEIEARPAAPGSDGKIAFIPSRAFATRAVEAATPALLLFPTIVDSPKSELMPLGQARTLEMLLPHALVTFDPDLARAQFQALGELVRSCEGFLLRFGRDVRALPALVDELLAARR